VKTQWDTVCGIKDPTMRASFRLNDTLDYSYAAVKDKVYMVNAATAILKAGNAGDAVVMISEYVYNPATCSGQVITRAAGGSLGKPKIEQTSNFRPTARGTAWRGPTASRSRRSPAPRARGRPWPPRWAEARSPSRG